MPLVNLPLKAHEHALAAAIAAELQHPVARTESLLAPDTDPDDLWEQAVALVGIARRLGWSPAESQRAGTVARPSTF